MSRRLFPCGPLADLRPSGSVRVKRMRAPVVARRSVTRRGQVPADVALAQPPWPFVALVAAAVAGVDDNRRARQGAPRVPAAGSRAAARPFPAGRPEGRRGRLAPGAEDAVLGHPVLALEGSHRARKGPEDPILSTGVEAQERSSAAAGWPRRRLACADA